MSSFSHESTIINTKYSIACINLTQKLLDEHPFPENIEEIDCSYKSDVKSVNRFVNLRRLVCCGHTLNQEGIMDCVLLESVDCAMNPNIYSLSHCPKMTHLSCVSNTTLTQMG